MNIKETKNRFWDCTFIAILFVIYMILEGLNLAAAGARLFGVDTTQLAAVSLSGTGIVVTIIGTYLIPPKNSEKKIFWPLLAYVIGSVAFIAVAISALGFEEHNLFKFFSTIATGIHLSVGAVTIKFLDEENWSVHK